MELRVGIWNMERDGDPTAKADEAMRLVKRHRLNALLLAEANDYVDALERATVEANRKSSVPAVGVDPRSSPAPQETFRFEHPGRNETAVLIAPGVHAHRLGAPHLTWRGWRTVRGGWTPPKDGTTVVLAHRLRVLMAHPAPSVRWVHRHLVGPVLRVASMAVHNSRMVRWANVHTDKPLMIAADWNGTPTDRGRYSPAWVARKVHGQIVAPVVPTHGGHRTLDFAVVRGCHARVDSVLETSSDHALVVLIVST